MIQATIIFALVLLNVGVFAQRTRQNFDTDDRLDVYESTSEILRDTARSTFVMASRYDLHLNVGSNPPTYRYAKQESFVTANDKVFSEDRPLCPNEKFYGQPKLGFCSGFLIGEDQMVASGHCTNEEACTNGWSAWILGWHYTAEGVMNYSRDAIPKSAVYFCKEMIHRVGPPEGVYPLVYADHAVLRLDRPVTSQTGTLRIPPVSTTPVVNGQSITVIGSPRGLPVKIATGSVRTIDTPGSIDHRVGFRMDADTFGGNSGSIVVDTLTGDVVGILGQVDLGFVETAAGCMKHRVCDQAFGCNGNWFNLVTGIMNAAPYLDRNQPDAVSPYPARTQPWTPATDAATPTYDATTQWVLSAPSAGVDVATGLPKCISVTGAGAGFGGSGALLNGVYAFHPNIYAYIAVDDNGESRNGGGVRLVMVNGNEWHMRVQGVSYYKTGSWMFGADWSAMPAVGAAGETPTVEKCPVVDDTPVITVLTAPASSSPSPKPEPEPTPTPAPAPAPDTSTTTTPADDAGLPPACMTVQGAGAVGFNQVYRRMWPRTAASTPADMAADPTFAAFTVGTSPARDGTVLIAYQGQTAPWLWMVMRHYDAVAANAVTGALAQPARSEWTLDLFTNPIANSVDGRFNRFSFYQNFGWMTYDSWTLAPNALRDAAALGVWAGSAPTVSMAAAGTCGGVAPVGSPPPPPPPQNNDNSGSGSNSGGSNSGSGGAVSGGGDSAGAPIATSLVYMCFSVADAGATVFNQAFFLDPTSTNTGVLDYVGADGSRRVRIQYVLPSAWSASDTWYFIYDDVVYYTKTGKLVNHGARQFSDEWAAVGAAQWTAMDVALSAEASANSGGAASATFTPVPQVVWDGVYSNSVSGDTGGGHAQCPGFATREEALAALQKPPQTNTRRR